MRLITGPAGSGKTSLVLERFREALRARKRGVRLLVPTSTMAQHLQNVIAREGFVFPSGLIQTLSGFVENRVADFPQAPETVLYLIVEQVIARVNRPEFRRVAELPGFCASVARTISEFSSAGCDSARLAACLPDALLAAAFLAVYQEVDRELERRGLLLRSKRLECAAARIRAEGTGGIETFWLDGFHALPDPELAVIRALGQHAEVTLTLAEEDAGEARPRLLPSGFREERLTNRRAAPVLALTRAPGIERECEEIARRILEQVTAGRPFREMGIIVRPAKAYVRLLRTTLERFGIPARFYFDEAPEEHPVSRFLMGAVDAMLGGWDHSATMGVLRLAPRFAHSPAMDRLDFAVREQIPNRGLAALKQLAGNPESPLPRLIDSLGLLDEWQSLEMKAADWGARFQTLRNWYRVARPEMGSPLPLPATEAAVLDLWDEAVKDAVLALNPQRVLRLPEFWRAVKSVVRLKPLRIKDARRNVVHVLSAHEARQWALPVVFVCGLVERQFPQVHLQDAFFSDAARRGLQGRGIRVRTAADFEREERALFDLALTRASTQATLSYPEFNWRGEANLPSLFLEPLQLTAEEARQVRPRPAYTARPPAPPVIRDPEMLLLLREKTSRLTASGLDSYQQCPFQFFGSRTLRLKPPPPRPAERLSFLLQGEIVHDVLAQWYVRPQAIEPLFQDVFEKYCSENRIPPGYHTERLRNGMLKDLERFVADTQWPRGEWESQMEVAFDFELPLPDGSAVTLAGRIDRLDAAADGRAYVIDYKYSPVARVREKKQGKGMQAPLYVLALEKALGKKPAGMFFVALKAGLEYQGWSDEGRLEAESLPGEWVAETTARVQQIVEEMRTGRVAPQPADRSNCRFCDERDVCRIDVRQAAVRAEGA